MSLRSRIQDLRTAAAAANDEHQVQLRAGQFAGLSDRVRSSARGLPALKVGLAEVRRLDVKVPIHLDQETVQVVDGLREVAAELPAMAVDADMDLAEARVRNAEKYAAQLRAFVTDTWQRHVSQPLPPVNSELVDALAQSGVDVEPIRDALESAQGRLLAITNRTIPLEGDVDNLSAAFESFRACGDQIGSAVDPDVAEGILGAQEEFGMPLAWFTAKRLQALADLGIIDRFRVRLQ